MDEKVKNTETNSRLTARQQRLLLRAVVGSLVISAALAAPHASAQTPTSERYKEIATEYPRFGATTPFLRVLVRAASLHRDGLISSGDTFEVTFEARRARDGSLHDVKVTGVAAVNPRWPDLMRDLVAAVGESRVLAPLEDAERLSITFALDDRRGAFAGLNFDAPSAERADQLRAGYQTLLQAAATQARGRPEEALFRGAHVTANGKQFALTLEMPREQLGNLLRQSLAKP